MPERKGNRRADGFLNLLTNPQVGLLFLIPGRTDTLRINGRAEIVSEAPFMDAMAIDGRRPVLALVIDVHEVFFHWSKAPAISTRLYPYTTVWMEVHRDEALEHVLRCTPARPHRLMGVTTATPAEPAVWARQVAVPPATRRHITLAWIGYEDAFLVETMRAQERTAEQWTRAILEDAPSLVGRKLRLGWSALGLKLGPARADGRVLGWEVRRSAPDFVLLGAESRLGMPGELLFERRGDTLLVATFVQPRHPVARAMWAAVAPSHRQVVPRLLGRAVRA